MSDVAFHIAEEFIAEDLDYYFSGERDKNNQIRPNDNIYSMTPSSSHLSHTLGDGEVANFFYPLQPNILDRIYIGISVPLFANNWGASFLLQLLKLLKPDGAIILPVYPEGQAQEKGYWSRSFLENIFLSRQRWTGFSNVTAENDGVMSLRVGRKWPEPMPSTIEWFYQQGVNIVLGKLSSLDNCKNISKAHIQTVEKVWSNYSHSAVVEKIILDFYGAKKPITVKNITDDYGLLVTDLLLTPYVNVTSGSTHVTSSNNQVDADNFKHYFLPHVDGRHVIDTYELQSFKNEGNSDVICIQNLLVNLDASSRQILLDQTWKSLNTNGVLIVYEDLSTNQSLTMEELNLELENFASVHKYSSIVASRIQENVEISHYSTLQEAKLVEEKQNEAKIFRVMQK